MSPSRGFSQALALRSLDGVSVCAYSARPGYPHEGPRAGLADLAANFCCKARVMQYPHIKNVGCQRIVLVWESAIRMPNANQSASLT
ncbi:hypothetical protein PsYK624_152510 [Phanerochaete sordida]|uniref:Uncharacterized protein n=1 Tax=Phanerochaete sordida TaxID=48140 RepID=A0A9P3LKV4_9APHY|nr:hypothetical protein PsYK624_152510 [Phanerochaete sordida]